jgi:PAS domain S-box-containing protein
VVEAALREGEARFRSLFDAAPVMMWVTDAAGRCTQVNRRWSEFTGQAEAGALGRSWLDAVHPDDRDRLEAGFLAANARREGYRAEYRMRRADGAWRWVLKTAEPRFAEGGTYCGLVGSSVDITERREAEERQALLLRELDHRAKNALAVVQAAVQLTPANDAHSFAEAVRGRVDALARAHTLLAAGRWSSADLRQLVAAELAPFLHTGGGSRAELDGPPVALAPHAAQALSMAVHELATNATKHGALSAPGGHLAVSWRVDPAAGTLRLRWVEDGGPAVAGEPSRRGFGSRLIETTIRRQLGGTLSRAWTPTGLVLEFDLPLARVLAGPGARDAA